MVSNFYLEQVQEGNEDEIQESNLCGLPIECWPSIFSHLTFGDLNGVCLVCRIWKEICYRHSHLLAWNNFEISREKLRNSLLMDKMTLPERMRKILVRVPRMFPLTDQQMSKLTQCERLKRFNITARDLSQKGFEFISKLPRLESITMRGVNSNFSDQILMTMCQCKSLKKITLCSVTQITDLGFEYFLKNCSTLQSVWISCAQISDGALEHLPSSVKKLSMIQWPHITDEALAILARKDTLQELELGSLKITKEGIDLILKCRNLQRLQIRTCSSVLSSVYIRNNDYSFTIKTQ